MSGRRVVVTVLAVALLVQGQSGSFKSPTGKTKVFPSAGCSRRPPTGTDCSTVEAGPCSLTLKNGEIMNLNDRGLAPNSRSCYRTCITSNPSFPDRCEVDRIAFENQSLPTTTGKSGGVHFLLSSPNFHSLKEYRKCTVCRYRVSCGPGQLAGFMFTHHVIEEATNCTDGGSPQCLDGLTVSQYGGQITTCGSSLHPMEAQPEELLVRFKTNRKIEDCGFNVMVTCSNMSSFFRPSCIVPGNNHLMAFQETRRNTLRLHEEDLFRVRSKRCYREARYTVSVGAVVTYSNNTVQVMLGKYSFLRFANIGTFQVYNRVEGYMTFYGDGPPDRVFPGYGYLQKGDSTIHYTQEGIPPEFRPSAEEEKVIRQLMEGIAVQLAGQDTGFDVDDNETAENDDSTHERDTFFPYATLNVDSRCAALTRTTPQVDPRLITVDAENPAIKYSNACNGFLKETACAYQKTVLGRQTCTDHPFSVEREKASQND